MTHTRSVSLIVCIFTNILTSSANAATASVSGSSPSAGSSTASTFQFSFSDTNGWQSLQVLNVLINNVLDGRHACYVAFIPSAGGNGGTLDLVDDAGDAGGPYSTTLLPGTGTVQNSQCSISASNSSVTTSGSSMTLTLAVAFLPAFSGNKVLYMAARDASSNSGWVIGGVWNVPGATPTGPSVLGVSPPVSANTAQSYTFTFADSFGWSDISVVDILVNNAINGASACYIAYVPINASMGTVDLVDDRGDAGGPYANMMIPGTRVVSNSQCSVSASGSSVTATGTTLTLTLAITFSGTFTPGDIFYLAARSNSQNSNWQAVGFYGTGILPVAGYSWNELGSNFMHTADSSNSSQPLYRIHWADPVDLQPEYSGTDLLIHYGTPVVTASNTVIFPVKTGAGDGFRVEARNGADGTLRWTASSDYTLPPHNWVPEFGIALAPSGRLFYPGPGGTVYYRDTPDSQVGAQGRLVFYGASNYYGNPGSYDIAVKIVTPITTDGVGNIYFGFQAAGGTAAALVSGIARIDASGNGTWISASAAANDTAINQVRMNCAPAINPALGLLYITVSDGYSGYLVALNMTTLQRVARVRLVDPQSGQFAALSNDSSSSPTIGPDGDVYFGVEENPSGMNDGRGWLLHFDSTLSRQKPTGAFGWDDTPSIVPSSMVPSYTGFSNYLIMSKYNDYIEINGSGLNKLAILDPNATESDPISRVTTMKEILTVVGPTPNPDGGVSEWCINSAAVDPATKSVLAGSEDGKLYRWDLTSNSLTQTVVLTSGIGEAYTPTAIGPDGTVYAINNATLFAVGR